MGIVVLAMLVALLSGCRSTDETISGPKAPNGQTLVPVSLPDLSRADDAVQAQARERYTSLMQKVENPGTGASERATAYGELGMLFQAIEYFDAAEPCYINAQALSPSEVRWPYYLGHLHKSKGDFQKAAVWFNRVLELRPDDLATLVWLGRVYLEAGRLDEAEPLFTRARTLSPRSTAALAGLGRAVLAKRDYSRSVRYLEEALTIDPQAESLHSPLATAFQALGQHDKAEAHLRQWRNRDVLPPDPLKEQLDLVLQSGLSYERRGSRALEHRDWTAAAALFRKGLELAPANSSLRRSVQHKLGTALFMIGDVTGAVQQFEEVVQLSPVGGHDQSAAKAHYSLAVLLASQGRGQQAIDHFSAAVTYQPNYVEAHFGLADTLRRNGRPEASLPHYEEVIRMDPRAAQARLGYAFALVRLRRYRDARDWLTEAVPLHPGQPELAHALARLLAAAPDDRVRDGRRAMALVQELFKELNSTDFGETMAMVSAEVGDYVEAAAIQRAVLTAARRAGLADAVRRMAENLQLYERHQPSRTPWRDDDPVHRPGQPVGPDLLEASTAAQN